MIKYSNIMVLLLWQKHISSRILKPIPYTSDEGTSVILNNQLAVEVHLVSYIFLILLILLHVFLPRIVS